MKYKSMEELLTQVQPGSLRGKLADIYYQNKERFIKAKGSEHNHQVWEGGYLDHVVDTMNTARLLYQAMNDKRQLPFTLSDALVALFLHDLEKPFGERVEATTRGTVGRKEAKSTVRSQLFSELGINSLLSDQQINAIWYTEGEGVNYSNRVRVMIPLAAFCHMCDVTSARIWFDYPRANQEDSWGWRESTAPGD